jgi:hypothetical protein
MIRGLNKMEKFVCTCGWEHFSTNRAMWHDEAHYRNWKNGNEKEMHATELKEVEF